MPVPLAPHLPLVPASERAVLIRAHVRSSILLLGLLGISLLVAALACTSGAASGHRVSLVDDAGDTVRLAVPARRIVSLIPATTELLFAIGAGQTVVGRTQWCDYPAAVGRVPNLGDGINPNLEAILASHPDLVFLYNSTQNGNVAARLRTLGIAALRLNTDALADVRRIGRLLGRITGHERAADSMVAVFDTALAAATVRAPPRRPKVLLLVWDQPPMTIGRGSFMNELVERAGGANLFGDLVATDGIVSIEAVAVRDPDLILTTSAGPSSIMRRSEWQVVRAVRQKRFLPVSGSEFIRPSPRAAKAIRELTRMLEEAR